MDIAQAATKDIAITIAAAQCTSVPLDVAANVLAQLRFVEAAADYSVQWLVFPELSLNIELERNLDSPNHEKLLAHESRTR